MRMSKRLNHAGAGNDAVRPHRIGIFHPSDPAAHIPGGIETVIRGILKWAPADLDYTLFGATSDSAQRPIGQETEISLGGRSARFLPIVSADPSSTRGTLPLTARFLYALRRYKHTDRLRRLEVLDFHRIEPIVVFRDDPRPKNVMLHQDMSAVIRDRNCDMAWRHAPQLYERMERWLLERADRVFCVRQSAIDRYRTSYPALADRFTFIPTWVDNTVFFPTNDSKRAELKERITNRLGIPASTRILVSVGRLDRQKDPLLLLDALKAALKAQPELHLILVGDGIQRPRVEASCRLEELIGKVSLLGARPPEEIADLLRAADLFVLCSAYEGMPIVVLEALATGLPVVTTNVGEVRLVVQNDVDGTVVTERSPRHLALAICKTLAQLDSLRGAACAQAVAPYLPDRVLGRIYENHRSQATRSRVLR
jgi:glycosyltransferase involved in cell wall biosynthesis